MSTAKKRKMKKETISLALAFVSASQASLASGPRKGSIQCNCRPIEQCKSALFLLNSILIWMFCKKKKNDFSLSSQAMLETNLLVKWKAYLDRLAGNWLRVDNNRSIGMNRHRTHDTNEKLSHWFLQSLSSVHTKYAWITTTNGTDEMWYSERELQSNHCTMWL